MSYERVGLPGIFKLYNFMYYCIIYFIEIVGMICSLIWCYYLLHRSVMSSRGSAHTCPISRLLFFMVVSISKVTKIYWKTNAHILLLGHLVEYLHWPEIRTSLWRMWGILSLMNVTKCLNHLVSFHPLEFLISYVFHLFVNALIMQFICF